ncbi:CAP domain-containing protein [Sporosarcina cyprini]|uniref:CAP domain-containing protein n=1 Tax=Sporosarcina cyprini TaxID=2910523 RepID=UPI001EDD4982|nr:CAP domain-containing protein [Sporosarcina cyprini]MCG3088810.1 CAP domain-containing protein [Sporosarcina cyprini]
MKKSMAVILLGSALLMSNNHYAEASYYNNEKAPTNEDIKVYVYEGNNAYSFSNQKEAQEFLNNYKIQWENYFSSFQGNKPVFNKPVQQQKPGKPVEQQKPTVPSKPVEQAKPVEKPDTTVPNNPNQNTDSTVTNKPETPPTATSASAIEKAVLDLTNAERQKAGLKPLAMDDKLMKSARAKSADMASKKYFDHNSPTYGSPFDQMKSFGISYRSAAENIAMGQRSAEEVVKAWMESPGHRQNILTPGFTHIGIGYDANGNYWTQQFIQK